MNLRLELAIVALLLAVPGSAMSAEQTVVLDVQHADCVLCGSIVKTSLERVNGVKKVNVSQPDAMADVTATVQFDDEVTNAPALIAATTNAGYPATVAR